MATTDDAIDQNLFYWGGEPLPTFKFSAKFPLSLHVILKLHINKFKTWLNQMHKIRWGAALHLAWNNLKWDLFINYTVICLPLMVALPECCHRLLPDWIGYSDPPPVFYDLEKIYCFLLQKKIIYHCQHKLKNIIDIQGKSIIQNMNSALILSQM